MVHSVAANPAAGLSAKGYFGVFRYSRRALELVWSTSKTLTLALAVLTLIAGVLPALVAYLGQLIVDTVVGVLNQEPGATAQRVLWLVMLEGVVVAAIAGAQTGLNISQSLLRALLGQRVNVLILEKALQLSVAQFEDSEFYDRLTRARREASSRPLSLVTRTFGLMQNLISILSFAGLLWQFSPFAVLILLGAGLPAFLAEARFSGEAFRLFYWRSPETRQRAYLESVMAREDYVKEVKLYHLGPLLLGRYRNIFEKLYTEDRALTLRRGFWTFGLGLLGTAALYGSYVWIALTTLAGAITLGQMTMYMMVFRQGQSAVSASLSSVNGMYEDNLYLSNLYAYLEEPVEAQPGALTAGIEPADGIRFENVGFRYPGASHWAVRHINLHIRPGQSLAIVGENGSGKTTLIKLMARLYEPQEGHILLDGTDLNDWEPAALQRRIGVIFQDYARYQMLLGENIGAGDVDAFEDEERWQRAAEKGMVTDFLPELADGFQTQLGRWFMQGRELSGGQWQKVALARAFMREDADILVLDEPTAAIDAEAEARIFEHFSRLAQDRITVLISHRFSTVRTADQIVVLERGAITEQGTHEELVAAGKRYATLFELQAKGYQ